MSKVLIAILKTPRDLNLLLNEKWYRIPEKYAPKREYDIIAFYQPSVFREKGKRIEYYGVVKSKELCKRKELINDGIDPNKTYYKISFMRIIKLKNPIVNNSKLRVSFKFTTFNKLYNSKNLRELFDVPDIESMVEKELIKMGIDYKREYTVKTPRGKVYRLDFCLFYGKKIIDLECDGEKWHSLKAQKIIDNKRDDELRKMNFEILRLKEKEILTGSNKLIETFLNYFQSS